MKTEPQKQHLWLEQLVGDWTYEGECATGPDAPAQTFKGTESVRSIGGLWVLCEGRGEMPGGEMATTLMTLGFEPRTGRYVGSWVGSMMTHLWVYDGSLDSAQKVLTLAAEGPSFTADGNIDPSGKMARYRDVIEMESPDQRSLTSWLQGDDGEWTRLMKANYRRKW